MTPYRYFVPTEIHQEAGALSRFRELCPGLGQRPLIVTGRTSAKRSGALPALLEQFPQAAVFDEVEENPGTATCEGAAAFCRARQCDWVIGVGGGSPLDAAKAVALLASNGGGCEDYFAATEFREPVLPIVAIPTTAGTGSEVTQYSVLVDSASRTKRTLRGNALFPRFALLDASLTRTLPRPVIIATGLDALSQAMEGMVSKRATPFGNVLALETIRLIRRWLPVAASTAEDDEARGQMQFAAMLSGCVIAQSGTTLVHGTGYYYTLDYGIAHGMANALLLAPVFRFNANFAPEAVAAIAHALGQDCAAKPAAAADAVTRGLHGLFEALGVSPAAEDWGVPEQAVPGMAQRLSEDKGRFKNQLGSPDLDVLRGFLFDSVRGF